jgi:glycosyltransferase involved in cell wall biosynthesis
MRVLMICRKYTGIAREAWRPAGTPAVVKLIEALEERGHPSTVLFLAKGREPGAARRDLVTDYGRFHHVRFVHLRWRGLAVGPALVSNLVNSTRQFIRVLPYLVRRADIVYFDRAHLAHAALVSLFHRRVVWRCLGVMSFLLARDAGKRLGVFYLGLARLLVRFPIRLMVCTNDGSPWFRLFPPGSARRRLLLVTNGVDHRADRGLAVEAGAFLRNSARPRIAFIGRTTIAKGIDRFVDLCAELTRRGFAFEALVIGEGADRAAAESRAAALGLGETVRFHGLTPHSDVMRAWETLDVYVTPAINGAFSNTTLEALGAGCCVVALRPDAATGVDATTLRFLPEGVVHWAERTSPIAGLADAVGALVGDASRLAAAKRTAHDFARRNLKSWSERVSRELDLLESLAAGEAPPEGALAEDALGRIAFATTAA